MKRNLTITICGEGRASGKTMMQMELARILVSLGHSVTLSDCDTSNDSSPLRCAMLAYENVLSGDCRLDPVNIHIHVANEANAMNGERLEFQRLAGCSRHIQQMLRAEPENPSLTPAHPNATTSSHS